MGFKPGHPKVGGRKKGTPNKRTQQIEELLEQMGCDPFKVMALICVSTTATDDMKLRAAKELAPYIAPKLGSIEVKDVTPEELSDQELKETILELAQENYPDLLPEVKA
jgi:hypothetical protein